MPAFGPLDARLLIVGLAPGLRGANRTGRPFTGDYAGDLLYGTLTEYGFAQGVYRRVPGRRACTLVDCRIANAVICVPPENKLPLAEINTCRGNFSSRRLAPCRKLRAIVPLGRVAHETTLEARSDFAAPPAPFAHGAIH